MGWGVGWNSNLYPLWGRGEFVYQVSITYKHNITYSVDYMGNINQYTNLGFASVCIQVYISHIINWLGYIIIIHIVLECEKITFHVSSQGPCTERNPVQCWCHGHSPAVVHFLPLRTNPACVYWTITQHYHSLHLRSATGICVRPHFVQHTHSGNTLCCWTSFVFAVCR